MAIVLVPCGSMAGGKSKATAKASQTKTSDYPTWLKQYGAYDVLQRSLADKAADKPPALLDRARAFLEMNDAHSALELLNNQEPFQNKAQEAKRLLLLARAQRFIGLVSPAVHAYSQTGRLMGTEDMVKTLSVEPGLADLWRDVWRKWVWQFIREPDSAESQALKPVIETALDQALALWKNNDLWNAMSAAWKAHASGQKPSAPPSAIKIVQVPDKDRQSLAMFLAHVSLGQWDSAMDIAESMESKNYAVFWRSLSIYLRDDQLPENPLGEDSTSLIKADVFLNDMLPTLPSLARGNWQISEPMVPSWALFSGQLAAVDADQALTIIEREAKSLLLSPETMQTLQHMALAFAILHGDVQPVHTAWEAADKDSLPLPLQLAGAIVLDLPATKALDAGVLQSGVAEAAGLEVERPIQAPFWVAINDKTRDAALEAWPLDDQLLLGYLKRSWRNKPTPELARRMGLLFPETPAGMEAILSLAEEAGKAGLFGLSATYLAMVDMQRLSPGARAAYLHSRARLEVELGREDRALGTYEELLALDRNRLSISQKLQLALLAQQRGRLALAEDLLTELWSQRAELEPSVQAELLFYQAEVAHSSGRIDQALDTYLRLAYLYPEQNIWAVTALYRAALLYEGAGRYDSAKRLLTTVVRNADRKSQKEAAEERLKVVESRLATEQRNLDGQLYPF